MTGTVLHLGQQGQRSLCVIRDGNASNPLAAFHERRGTPVEQVGRSNLLLFQAKGPVLFEEDIFVVHSPHLLLVGDDVMVIAAMALTFSVESQVVMACDMERSQPAPKRDVFIAVQFQPVLKTTQQPHQAPGEDIAPAHCIWEVVRADGPVPLPPPSRSLWNGMPHEVAPVEARRAAQGPQGELQLRDTDVGIIICLHQVVKLEVLVCPDNSQEHFGREVGVGLLVPRQEQDVVEHLLFCRQVAHLLLAQVPSSDQEPHRDLELAPRRVVQPRASDGVPPQTAAWRGENEDDQPQRGLRAAQLRRWARGFRRCSVRVGSVTCGWGRASVRRGALALAVEVGGKRRREREGRCALGLAPDAHVHRAGAVQSVEDDAADEEAEDEGMQRGGGARLTASQEGHRPARSPAHATG